MEYNYNYKEQNDIKCCALCKQAMHDLDDCFYCMVTGNMVWSLGVCDKFEGYEVNHG